MSLAEGLASLGPGDLGPLPEDHLVPCNDALTPPEEEQLQITVSIPNVRHQHRPNPNSYQLYFKSMWVRLSYLKSFGPGTCGGGEETVSRPPPKRQRMTAFKLTPESPVDGIGKDLGHVDVANPGLDPEVF